MSGILTLTSFTKELTSPDNEKIFPKCENSFNRGEMSKLVNT